MPLYEYKCTDCGEQFEELIGAGSSKKPVCPACGSTASEKLLSAFAPTSGGTSARTGRRSSRGGCGGVGFS